MKHGNLDFYLWQKVMMEIGDNQNMNKVSRDMGVTYAHTSKIIHLLKTKGFVSLEKTGRQYLVNLTIEGKKLATALRKVRYIVDNKEVNIQDPYEKELGVEYVVPKE